MSEKYRTVRVIASVLKVLGWVALAIGLILAVVALTMGGGIPFLPSMGAIVALLLGISWFIQLYAFGSILSLLVDIEENTRELVAEPTTTVVAAA